MGREIGSIRRGSEMSEWTPLICVLMMAIGLIVQLVMSFIYK